MTKKKNFVIRTWEELVATKDYFKKNYPNTYRHVLSVLITGVSFALTDVIAFFTAPEAWAGLEWKVIAVQVGFIILRSVVKALVQDVLPLLRLHKEVKTSKI